MDYAGASDSSGTDDDLPPSHQNRFHRGGGRAGGNGNGNGRSGMLGNASLPRDRVHSDMESQIHQIEQEAYFAVLRAFKVQADAISWEKEGLMTELRKELRVSDDEHRVVLSRVNADDMIHQIREWREGGGFQLGRFSTSQTLHDPLPSPTVSASFKKQKTTKQTSLSTGAPSPGRHPSNSKQPSSSALRGEPPSRSKNKKSKPYPSADGSGRVPGANRGSVGASTANKPAETANYDPLIGKKVWTRWPEDNNFYEAVITDYDPAKGLHSLVYEINTDYQSWEWVNLKEIAPEDIRWEGEYPRKGGRPGPGPGSGLAPGRVVKKAAARGGAVSSIGRGRGTTTKGQTRKVFQSSQNGSGKKPLGDIEILHTETLIKELEKVFSLSNLDPVEIEKAKKVLKDHEEALENAIARLEDASDGESAEGEQQKLQRQPQDQERGWRKRPFDEGRVESSNSDKKARHIQSSI